MLIFPFPGSFWTPTRIRGGCTGWNHRFGTTEWRCFIDDPTYTQMVVSTSYSHMISYVKWCQMASEWGVYPKFTQNSWANQDEPEDLGPICACIQARRRVLRRYVAYRNAAAWTQKRVTFPGKQRTDELDPHLIGKSWVNWGLSIQRIMWQRPTIL